MVGPTEGPPPPPGVPGIAIKPAPAKPALPGDAGPKPAGDQTILLPAGKAVPAVPVQLSDGCADVPQATIDSIAYTLDRNMTDIQKDRESLKLGMEGVRELLDAWTQSARGYGKADAAYKEKYGEAVSEARMAKITDFVGGLVDLGKGAVAFVKMAKDAVKQGKSAFALAKVGAAGGNTGKGVASLGDPTAPTELLQALDALNGKVDTLHAGLDKLTDVVLRDKLKSVAASLKALTQDAKDLVTGAMLLQSADFDHASVARIETTIKEVDAVIGQFSKEMVNIHQLMGAAKQGSLGAMAPGAPARLVLDALQKDPQLAKSLVVMGYERVSFSVDRVGSAKEVGRSVVEYRLQATTPEGEAWLEQNALDGFFDLGTGLGRDEAAALEGFIPTAKQPKEAHLRASFYPYGTTVPFSEWKKDPQGVQETVADEADRLEARADRHHP